MGKTKSWRIKGNNRDCPNQLSVGKYSATVIPLVIILALIIFMVIFFIGERLGFLPYLTFVSSSASFSTAEGILLVIVMLGISIFLAMLIGYVIQRGNANRKKRK